MRPTPFLQAVITIARKDLQTELRNRQIVTAIGLFALIATMVFYQTLDTRPDVRLATLPSILWVIVVFAGTLGLGRSLAQEYDKGNLDGLLLAPIDRSTLFYGKLIGNFLFTLIVAVIVTLALIILFNANLLLPGWYFVLLLGTLGISSIGTLLGSMAVQGRGRETTLPIIILPIVLPVIMAAVNASTAILTNRPLEDWSNWLVLLGGMDVIFITLPLVLFDFIVED